MKMLLGIGVVLCVLGMSATKAEAASAVAWAPDFTFGYSFNQPNAERASQAALRGCQVRTQLKCEVKVVCDDGGFGAISLRRYPVGRIESIGASCGASQVTVAYGNAVTACNKGAKTGRCGHPRTAWRDTLGGEGSPSISGTAEDQVSDEPASEEADAARERTEQPRQRRRR